MLTDADRAAFDKHGWLVLHQAVAADRVAELESALDAVVPPGAYLQGYEGRVVEVASISMGAAALQALAHDRRLAHLAAQALGVTRIQFFQDTVFIKPARTGGEVAWHQDASYFAFLRPLSGVALRLALSTETVESGCLRVIDGSHRWGLQTPDLSFEASAVEDALATLPAKLRNAARKAERSLELEPGDLSLHHCLTFHSSAANRSGLVRKTLAVRYVDAGCTVCAERIPTHAAPRLPTDGLGHLTGPLFPVYR